MSSASTAPFRNPSLMTTKRCSLPTLPCSTRNWPTGSSSTTPSVHTLPSDNNPPYHPSSSINPSAKGGGCIQAVDSAAGGEVASPALASVLGRLTTCRKTVDRHETNLPAQRTAPQTDSWLPSPYGDEKRPACHQGPPRQGSSSPDGLIERTCRPLCRVSRFASVDAGSPVRRDTHSWSATRRSRICRTESAQFAFPRTAGFGDLGQGCRQRRRAQSTQAHLSRKLQAGPTSSRRLGRRGDGAVERCHTNLCCPAASVGSPLATHRRTG